MKIALTSAACSFSLLFALSSPAATPLEQLQQLKAETESGTASKLTSTLLALKDIPNPIGAVSARARNFPHQEALGARNGYVLVTAYVPIRTLCARSLKPRG